MKRIGVSQHLRDGVLIDEYEMFRCEGFYRRDGSWFTGSSVVKNLGEDFTRGELEALANVLAGCGIVADGYVKVAAVGGGEMDGSRKEVHQDGCDETGRGCTLNSTASPADICRQKGWRVGDVLVGDDGYGPTHLTVTAIGEKAVLAKTDSSKGECSFVLSARCWVRVSESPAPVVSPVPVSENRVSALKILLDDARERMRQWYDCLNGSGYTQAQEDHRAAWDALTAVGKGASVQKPEGRG